MAGRHDRPAGAWFVAPRVSELDSPPPGAVQRCHACGEEVWVAHADAELARSCAAIACPECTQTGHGILYIPPPED